MSDRMWLLILIGTQIVLCAFVLESFPIALDEPFSIYHAQRPLGELINEVGKGNNSPLHFVVLHFWEKLFGIGPAAVRSLSLVVSAVNLWVIFRFARMIWKTEYAVLIGALFIFSRLDHFVALEARMYGFFTLWFTLILYDFYRLIHEEKKVFIRLGIWNALLLYTHYLGGIVVIMEVLVFLFYYKKWTSIKFRQGLLTGLLGFILFLPGLNLFMGRVGNFSENGTWVPIPTIADLGSIFVKLMNNQLTLLLTSIVVIVLVIFMKIRGKVKEHLQLRHYFLIWFLGSYLVMFLLSFLIQPIFYVKYIQFLTIPLYFGIVQLLQETPTNRVGRVMKFLIIIPFALSFKYIPNVNREMDEIVSDLNNIRSSNVKTLVYYCPPHYDLGLAYYYDRSLFENYDSTSFMLKAQGIISLFDASELLNNTASDIIYLDFDAEMLYPDNGILDRLYSTHNFKSQREFKGDFIRYHFTAKTID